MIVYNKVKYVPTLWPATHFLGVYVQACGQIFIKSLLRISKARKIHVSIKGECYTYMVEYYLELRVTFFQHRKHELGSTTCCIFKRTTYKSLYKMWFHISENLEVTK